MTFTPDTSSELVLWSIADAWMAAVVAALVDRTTAGIPVDSTGKPIAFLSPKSPAIEEHPEYLAVWVHSATPSFQQTELGDRILLAGSIDATVRLRIRRQLTIPVDGEPADPIVETRDAGVVHADLWAVTQSWSTLPAAINARLANAHIGRRDISVGLTELAGTGFSHGVDAEIVVRVPATAACVPADG